MTIVSVSPVGPDLSDQVLRLFAGEWWTDQRTAADVAAILSGSTETVGLLDDGELIGFARVISDRHYLALVLDVIVAEPARGSGIGDQLIQSLLELPSVAEVASVELVCQPELFGFYERHGFTNEVGQSRLMRKTSDPRL